MNRRKAIKSILPAAVGVAALSTGAQTETFSGVLESRELTTAEAFDRLAAEINSDEGYRRGWQASIALLLNALTVPESESVRQLRVDLGMTPQRLVDPRNLEDCNYFAERLLAHIFGKADCA